MVQMNLFSKQKQSHRCKEHLDTRGKVQGGMNREIGIDIYICVCIYILVCILLCIK